MCFFGYMYMRTSMMWSLLLLHPFQILVYDLLKFTVYCMCSVIRVETTITQVKFTLTISMYTGREKPKEWGNGEVCYCSCYHVLHYANTTNS